MIFIKNLYSIVVFLQVLCQYAYGQQDPSFREDYRYVDETKSFYKFNTERRSWQDAINTCNSEGTTLFYPANKCEAKAVLNYWSQTQTIGWTFIGVSSRVQGIFETVDGRSILDTYSEWRPGEPNNASGDEGCVVLLRDGTINDVQCGETFPFICKKKLDANQKETPCDKSEEKVEKGIQFRKDYKYLEETHGFYKIHTIAQNWRDANDMCKKEGATLFYPKNKCEANVVMEVWNQTQPFDKVFVGITSSTKGSFVTIDGGPVWNVYNIWRPGQPNNANGNENCVVLYRDGVYNDVQCGENFPFICKKTIDTSKENVICDQPETDQQVINFREDYTYIEDTQSLYKIHTIFRTWQDAKDICANESASLFYPENECEANTVLEFWNQTQPFGWVYIGVTNPTREATVLNFETIDGRPVYEVYNIWRRGEPNNVNGEENCVVLVRDGTLNDDRCDKNFAFICKKEITSLKGNAYCSNTEASKNFRKDYKYLEDTQSFYKIQTIFQTWHQAKATCEREGSVLYYPENKCEAQLVIDYWNKEQPFRRIYVGISSPKRGVFETVDGFPAWKMYSEWRPGEPNNENDEQGCVVFKREDGLLSDEKCDQRYPFICKSKNNTRKSNFGCDKSDKDEKSVMTFRNDYRYIEDTQSFYKIHTITNNFENAKQMCESENSTLYYPENTCESKAFLEFWDKTQDSLVDWALIGVLTKSDRIFESIDGRREPNLYLAWKPNEPNNSGDNEDCVTLNRLDNLLNDADCRIRHNFVCKKKVDFVKRDAFCDTLETGQQASFRSDYKYLNDTNSYYKYHAKERTWKDAVNFCTKEGASLFFPVNKCETNAVIDYWNKIHPLRWVYIGISSRGEGIYNTLDYESISDVYNNWRPGEPNNEHGNENCVILLGDGTLNDVQCEKSFPFICKKKLDSKNGEGLCDKLENEQPGVKFRKDYTYLDDTRSFYKIHTVRHRWQDAKEICAKEGASLFYPGSRCEANVVLELWNQTQPFNRIFVGISSPIKGSFETIDGRPVWDVYNRWQPGEPNNANGDEDCVVLLRNGAYNDERCGSNFPFICKKRMDQDIATCDKPETINSKLDIFRKDYQYLEDARSFYKIHTISQNWQDAREECIKEGTTLFFPENEREANIVLDYMKQTQPFNWVYIGVSNPTKDTTPSVFKFMTIDGRPVRDVYNKWDRDEPNNRNGEEYCVILKRDGTLNDDQCVKSYAFICKITVDAIKTNSIQVKPETNENQNITFRQDYTYFEDTQSFYKIHTEFHNWHNAQQACLAEGANLFYPNNKCEADVVIGFWTRTQIFRRVYIGISSPSMAKFETIDGRPHWFAYTNWRPGEPDNANEACVILFRDGTLVDDQCNIKIPFICKKKIYSPKSSACSKLDNFPDDNRLAQKDYKYLEETQSLYKIFPLAQNWFEAKKSCFKEGGFLFYPENECETKAVIKFWVETHPFQWVFLGINSPVLGQFETIDGRPIWEVYNNWGKSEPNNSGDKERCVVIDRENALFNDDNCQKTNQFICKKKSDLKDGNAVCDKVKKVPKRIRNFLKDYTYLEDIQNLYKIHTIHRNGQNAKETCLKEGASLFYPENEREAEIILGFWNQSQVINRLLIGIAGTSKGTYETIDGRPAGEVYNKWAPGKPTGGIDDHRCTLLMSDGILDEDNCDNLNPFVCKKKLAALNSNFLCNMTDLSYIYNTAQERCYKFHLTPMNWTEANEVCTAEQSYLAVINSQAEADHLAKITDRAPKDQVQGNYLAGAVHLGFRNLDGNGWKSIHGKSLQETGYSRWGYNQPDGGDQERCGSMFYNGELNDIGCFHKCFFICEHDVDG